jgi:hypothetical protein
MRSKACDALCTSHGYYYSGKVSKNIQNSVKKSLQVLLFSDFSALYIGSRAVSPGLNAQRPFRVGFDHCTFKEHGVMLDLAPHLNEIVIVFTGEMP